MQFIFKYGPKFLRRIDANLRVNYPWLWATGIHVTLYLGVVFTVLFALIGWGYGVDIRDLPQMYESTSFFGMLFIPAAIFLFFTFYHMALFNSDKGFGKKFAYQEFFVFLIYIISFGLPLVIPFSAQLVIDYRIANLVGDEELDKSYKEYDYGKVFFPTSKYDYDYYPSDSIYVVEYQRRAKMRRLQRRGLHGELKKYREDTYSDSRYEMVEFWEEMADSIYWHQGVFKRERPKLYLSESGSDYDDYYDDYEYYDEYIDYGGYNEPWNLKDSLKREFVYQRNLDHDVEFAKEGIGNVVRIMDKYSYLSKVKEAWSEQIVLEDYLNSNYGYSVADAYLDTNLSEANRNMYRITRSKDMDGPMYESWFFVFLFVMVFYIAVVFNIFKNVHWKQFLLGIAVLAALATIAGTADEIVRARGELFLSSAVLVVVLSFVLSIRTFFANRYSVIRNQALVLLNLMLPVLPILILGFMDEVFDFFHWAYFDQYREMVFYEGEWHWDYTAEYHQVVELIRLSTFWAGLIIYPLIWNTYLKVLYLKMWALPSNK